MMFWKFLAYVALAMGLAGCSTLTGAQATSSDRDRDSELRRSGAMPTTHAGLESVNLIELLDPLGQVRSEYQAKVSKGSGLTPWDDLHYSVRYDLIFARFSSLNDEASARDRRNTVQNRLVVASERRCGRFVQYLKRDNSDTNFMFGVGSSLLSTAGALVPGLRAAQNLSGSSALLSGLRAEYNNEYYSNLAVAVIARAIEEKRSELRGKLSTGQSLEYSRYDIAAAVADAVRYDSSCNIVNGLEHANEALQRLKDPGREAINKALLQDRLTRALASGDSGAIKSFNQLASDLQIDVAPMLAQLSGSPAIAGDGALTGRDMQDLSSGYNPTVATRRMLSQARTSIKALEAEAVSAIADATTPANSQTMATLTAMVTASLATLTNQISSDVAGTGTTSCFLEASALAAASQQAQEGLQLALAKAEEARVAADRVTLQQNRMGQFSQKLARYAKAVQELTQNALQQIANALVPGSTDPTGKAFQAATSFGVIEKNIGSVLRCVAPAKT